MFPRTIRVLYNQLNFIKQSNFKVPTRAIPIFTPTFYKFSTELKNIATYDDVKNIKKHTLLIDVREPSELTETGLLPNSINIPIGDLENVFKNMSREDFCKRFGREKPSTDQEIIFSCKSGVRAEKAMVFISSLGYTNTRFYKGSWTDWAEKSSK